MVGIDPIHLLAQSDGSEEWIKLAIILVIAAVSALSGLIKRRSEGRQQRGQTGPEPSRQKTRPKANWRQRLEEELERVRIETTERQSREAEANRLPPPETVERLPRGSTAEAGSHTTMAKTRERERVAKEAVAAAQDIGRTALQPPELMPEPVAMSAAPPREPTSVPSGSRALIDLSDPEALRRAIVQYEVLGKPLGLRDLAPDRMGDRIS